MTKSIKNCRGQAIVEFALILPILMLILLGVVEFGRIYNASLMVNHASREGARTGSLGGSTLQIEEMVDSVMGSFDTARITVTISPTGIRSRGSMVKVTVNYAIDPMTSMIGDIIGTTLILEADTVMRVE